MSVLLIRLGVSKNEGGKMPRTKATTPLEERVCFRGHVGQYRMRSNAAVCHECSKIAVARFRERGGVPLPVVPLEERVCKQGHVGKYKTTPRGHTRCTECASLAVKAFNARLRDTTREELNLTRLTKRRNKLTAELAEVVLRIAFEESIIKQRQERE